MLLYHLTVKMGWYISWLLWEKKLVFIPYSIVTAWMYNILFLTRIWLTHAHLFTQTLHSDVCVCMCVRERERAREKEKEKERYNTCIGLIWQKRFYSVDVEFSILVKVRPLQLLCVFTVCSKSYPALYCTCEDIYFNCYPTIFMSFLCCGLHISGKDLHLMLQHGCWDLLSFRHTIFRIKKHTIL